MNYLSVCSGIEAATCAWRPLGWKPFAFSEIEPFPSLVLDHHYPDVPNLGDMTKFKEWPDATIDVLVGGTPCQSFSIAGMRKGLDDPRGNLMLTYGAIAAKYRPRWLVWENVPGVLSSNRGRDFGTFLGMLVNLGYGFAYRVLDAQYAGLAQRRRRVFVVGHLGDWRRAAAVLFERHSLSGNPAPSREKGKGASGSADGCIVGSICADSHPGSYSGQDAYTGRFICHSLRGEGFDASEDGTGRGTPLIAIQGSMIGRSELSGPAGPGWSDDGVSFTLTKTDQHAVAFAQNQRDEVRLMDVAGSLAAEPGAKQQTYVKGGMKVRRLTPKECERLQGFNPVLDIVRIEGCFDHQKKNATVEIQSHRLQSSAWNAAESDYLKFANTAAKNSITRQAGKGLHVALYAHQCFEANPLVLLRSDGALKSSASSAEKRNWSRSLIKEEDFAASIALHWESLVKKTTHGKAELQQSISLSFLDESGKASAEKYGEGSEASASAADIDVIRERFITSHLGRVTPTCDSPKATSLCSVIRAISLFIPNETSAESFCFDLVLERDYTNILVRGKPAADGPRYKALGNSFAVPVVRWIGQRIQQVEDACSSAKAAV